MTSTIVIAGIGTHPFGRFAESYIELGQYAAMAALRDAAMSWRDIDAAFCASMYLPATAGLRVLGGLGRTGIPVVDIEAACAGGAVALRQAIATIRAGSARTVLVLGVEKMPRGFLDPRMIYQDWQIQSGIALNPAYWAMRARRHMHDHGTTERQIALVAQKNHKNSVDSPICMYRKPFSLSEILASKYVCEPIRLLEICSPCDGAAAVVVTLRDTTTPAASRDVQIAASTHTTALYSADLRSPALSMSARVNNPGPTSTAADQSYQAAGLGPEDIDCLEVQDTDAFCELEAYEDLRLCAVGDGGAMIESGRTELGGAQPVNMSGGLISKGEPVGASHLGQIAEIVSQLRGEAGSRQVAGARTGLAHVLGAHGNSAVTILIR